MSPEISVLVPVYNVSDYIEKCASSLFEQTYNELEYIFVDDLSTDDSIDKLLKTAAGYPHRKEQMTIIRHTRNMGIAATRNTALKASRGKYIVFVDSDDYIAPDMVERLYFKAIESNADIVISDIYVKKNNETILIKDRYFENRDQRIKEIIICEKSQAAIWNKLIKKSLFERTGYFPENLNFYEDRFLLLKLYFFTNNITKIDQAFYYYVQNNANAITKKRDKMHFESVMMYWNLVESFLLETNQYENQKNVLEKQKVISKIKLITGTNSYKLRKEYANLFYEEETKYLSYFHRGEKFMLLLIRHKQFLLAHILYLLLVFKNRKKG